MYAICYTGPRYNGTRLYIRLLCNIWKNLWHHDTKSHGNIEIFNDKVTRPSHHNHCSYFIMFWLVCCVWPSKLWVVFAILSDCLVKRQSCGFDTEPPAKFKEVKSYDTIACMRWHGSNVRITWLCEGNPVVASGSPHRGQQWKALAFALLLARTSCWK